LIIVSDLHLGYEKCNVTAFTDFLEDCISNGMSKEYSLFILGDLWDLWRMQHKIILILIVIILANTLGSKVERRTSFSFMDMSSR
jgi:UDP-2,3-diacylglucosamine pyrophosphatase LpxH